MRNILLASVGLLAFAGGICAEDNKPSELKKALDKFNAEVKERQAEVDMAPPQFRKELADELKEFIIIENDYLFDIAEKEAESLEAFEIFAQMLVKAASKEKATKARQYVIAHHLTKPHIKKVLPMLAQAGDEASEALLKKVAETNEDKVCQAIATLNVGMIAQAAAKQTGGQEKEELLAKAAEWFSKAKEKYADVKHQNSTVGKIADARLAALKVAANLEVGKPVPDIVGEGIDGKTFKLSEANKGKVVMLSFWATWCPPCMRMVPHEVELVEKMNGRPFELIGVNGDPELTTEVLQTIDEKKITWRSFKNEQKDTPPLSETWEIGGWPTIYVIDAKGVIRHIQLGGGELEKLDKVIEDLVSEAEKMSK